MPVPRGLEATDDPLRKWRVTGSSPLRHPTEKPMDTGKTTPGEGFPPGVVAF